MIACARACVRVYVRAFLFVFAVVFVVLFFFPFLCVCVWGGGELEGISIISYMQIK